ncbi:MAG: SPOR domain-containing protein [Rhizobiaceae bacterium]|nr:SPOR domain-containing protein [Rhizobiaceae bacterium]
MCEYKNDFLMGPKTALESGEWLGSDCFASNAADDDLAQLAALVGSQSKLVSNEADDKIALADGAPALEFDLEEELARAFQTNESVSEPDISMADLGLTDPVVGQVGATPAPEPVVSSDTLQAQMESAAMLSPATESLDDPMSGIDFSDMIAEELDKALAEEAAGSLDPKVAPVQERPAFPADDIEHELSKLMGRPVFEDNHAPAAMAAAEASGPPMPVEIAEPWQKAEVVSEFPAHEMPDIANESPTHTEYTPVQMSDFEPEPTPVIAAADPVVEAPEDNSQDQINAVLGGAAALAAAASTSSQAKPPHTQAEPMQMEAGLAEQDADLRLRLDELDYEHGREKRRSGRRAAFAIVAVALLGGTAALAWNFVGGPTGDTPTLLASTEPVKVKPVDAGGKVVPNQDQAVYQVGDGDAASKQERLTDNKEQPITVAVSPTGAKTNARVTSNQGDTTPLELKPRSVRTVVVRPDGTIVSSEAPKPKPIVVGTTSVTAPALSLQNQVESAINTTPSGITEEPIQTAAIAAPKKVTTVPVTSLRTTEAAPAAATAAETVATPAVKPAVEPVAAAPKPEPASNDLPQVSSPYAVQVSSQRSAEGAKRSYATLSRRFASILDGRGVDYRQVEVKGKNYVRVRIPAQDRATANQICSQLKNAGGDCFVTR